ncbi:MAG: cytochrome P450 [Alphaproteobacteria bacterium]|nr:MAG: cytochrome P450 [Alphaproteobacteria bacterium]
MRDSSESDPQGIPVRAKLTRRPLGILSTLRAARRNVLEIVPELATRQPMITGRTVRRWHMIMHPRALRRVLRDNVGNYPRSVTSKRILEPGVGHSLFLAEGAEWRWQRRTAAPIFSQRNLVSLAPVMRQAARRSADRIAAHSGSVTDLYAEMVAVTFDIICSVTLAGGGSFDRDVVHNAINGYLKTVARLSILDIFGAPRWVPRPETLIHPNAARRLHRIADAVVRQRAAEGADTADLLDLLIGSTDPETGRRMNQVELRDNLLAFIVAGHETTALALAWTLYLLAFDPDAQERARAEVFRVLRTSDTAGPEHLDALPYTRAVIEEAMRLYPPAAFIARTAEGPDRLCGRVIERGETVMLPIYALHRHRLWWEEPDAFRPERFLNARPDRFTYLPFADGPRICIGAGFAMMEAQIVLATLLRRFRFESVGHTPEPLLVITLRPGGGVRLKVSELGPGAESLAA